MEKLPPQKGSTHFPMPQTAPNSHYLCLVYIEIHAENPKTALGKTMNTTEKGRNKIFFSPSKLQQWISESNFFQSWGRLESLQWKKRTCRANMFQGERAHGKNLLQHTKKQWGEKRYLVVAEVSNQHKLRWWFVWFGDCSCPSCQQTQER